MKSSKKALAFALAAAMAITGVPVTNAGAATTTAKLGATKATIYAGNSKYISVSTPSSWKSVKLSVSSSRTSVASVKKNNAKKKIRVDAVKAGTAKVTVKVTAKKSGKKVSKTLAANITVKEYKVRLVDTTGATVSNTEINTAVGSTVKLTGKTAPANAKVTYESDNTAAATVDETGLVTPVAAGKAVITAKTDKASDKVTIVVADKLTEGISVKLTNPSFPNEEKLTDAVLVGQSAVVEVTAVADGKPVAGKTVSITGSASGTANDGTDYTNYKLASNSAVTGADGKAQFVIQYVGTLTSSQLAAVAFNYSVTIPGFEGKTEGAVKFVSVNPINVNVKDAAKTIFKSVNDTKGDGVTKTYGTTSILSSNIGLPSEYVDSQQASLKDTQDHKVTFTGYQPSVNLPGFKTTPSEAKNFTEYPTEDGKPFVSGSYGTYENASSKTSHVFEIKVNPQELTWAQVNFENIRLSEDTKLHVELYANNTNPLSLVDQMVISGPTEQNKATYNVPLDTKNNSTWSKLYVKTWIESYGRVDTDKAGGYTITDVKGVYITQPSVTATTVKLENAKITWKTDSAPRSEEKILTNAEKGALAGSNLYSDLFTSQSDYYNAKITYTVPSYPYTGNAILKVYDDNNKIVAYYAAPTYNHTWWNPTSKKYQSDNKNTLKPAAYNECYRISEEEATRQIGEIVEDTGTSVTVNATNTGVTTLVGKVTDKDGNAIPGYDAINDTVYTSVQWCPRPIAGTTTTTASDDYYALIGQNVKVVAQLKDANNDDVSKAGVPITFKYDNAGADTAITQFGTTKLASSKATATDITLDGKTDEKGRVTLTLKSAEKTNLSKLHAVATDGSKQFNIVLQIKDNDATEYANIHWVEANLYYEYVSLGNTPVTNTYTAAANDFNFVVTDKNTSKKVSGYYPCETYQAAELVSAYNDVYVSDVKSNNTVTKDHETTAQQSAEVGTNWEYAVKVAGGDDGKITIGGLKLNVKTAGVGSYTAITDDPSYAKAKAYSEKIGDASITATLNNTADTSSVTMTKDGKALKYVGEGATVLDKQLKIDLNWTPSNVTPHFDLPNGQNVQINANGATTTIYVSVRDKFVNKVETEKMTLTADNADLSYVDENGNTVNSVNQEILITKEAFAAAKDGIVPVTVTRNNNTDKTIITAKVANETDSVIVRWVGADDAHPFKTVDPDVAKQTFKNGVVTLTLTKDIVESSVIAEGFQVGFDYNADGLFVPNDKIYDVESASVAGNVITLKLKNYNNDIPTGTKIYVLAKTGATNGDNAIAHTVTSVDGDVLSGIQNTIFKDKDGNAIPGGVIEIDEY